MQRRRGYEFVQVDVFTERMFGGNPLAVFPHGEGLTDDKMPAIAGEMNLSKTSSRYRRRARTGGKGAYFYPGANCPLRGTRPRDGVRARRTRDAPARGARGRLEEGVGPVPVQFAGDDLRAPTFLWMDSATRRSGRRMDRAAFAAALGLREADLLPDAPILTAVRARRGGTSRCEMPPRLTAPRSILRCLALFRGYDAEGVSTSHQIPIPPAGASIPVHVRCHRKRSRRPRQRQRERPPRRVARGARLRDTRRRGQCADRQRAGHADGTAQLHSCPLAARDRHATAITVGGGVVPVLEGTLQFPD